MRTRDEIEARILAISKLILKCETDMKHADRDLATELLEDIESYENELDILGWVLNESV